MNTTNQTKCPAQSESPASTVRPRRVSVWLAAGGVTILGAAVALISVVPFGLQQEDATKSTSAASQSALSPAAYYDVGLESSLPVEMPMLATSTEDLEAAADLIADGLEFTMAGAELTNQFGTFRDISNTLSWFSQSMSEPTKPSLMASQKPTGASLAALSESTPTASELAIWSLQNSPATR